MVWIRQYNVGIFGFVFSDPIVIVHEHFDDLEKFEGSEGSLKIKAQIKKPITKQNQNFKTVLTINRQFNGYPLQKLTQFVCEITLYNKTLAEH